MFQYKSLDGILIVVGQNDKENHQLSQSSSPDHWWMHVYGYPGSHVVIHHDGNTLPKDTKKDAMTLAMYHSKAPDTKISRVNLVRVGQVKCLRQSGRVEIEGDILELTIFMRREADRLKRVVNTREKIIG
jgi:predicted ribosome quality control (RQC) complex YloA/Tae2 family protein